MKFSLEEIFSMYGQYDKSVTIEFEQDSQEYQKFGPQLIGTFLFVLEDRKSLEETIKTGPPPRTDRKVKFSPSAQENLSDEQKMDLDKNGILTSSIHTVWSLNLPKKNRFSESGKKEIQNVVEIKAPNFSGWDELNRVRFGFLKSRFDKDESLSPQELIQFWAFKKHFEVDLKDENVGQDFDTDNAELKDKVRLEELRLKYQKLSITDEEIEEFAELEVSQILYKKGIIDKEIASSTEKINEISSSYECELENLKNICRSFDEKIIAFGKKIIFLEFERFVHIYARHVAETQIGERFVDNKTVFQYKFEDIIRVIKMVIGSVNNEIQEHFKQNPSKPFRRMGSRSIYMDGHYYRVQIEPSGMLKDFHPFNDDKNSGANIT